MSVHFWLRGRNALARFLRLELTYSQERYSRFLDDTLGVGDRWLDIGCGGQVVPSLAMPTEEQLAFVSRANMAIGLDVDRAIYEHSLLAQRVIERAHSLPFLSQSFDLVTANMVVEHVEDPLAMLLKIRRVLKPGGRFLFHTTNFRNCFVFQAWLTPSGLKRRIASLLEHRGAEEVFPTFYRFNTETRIYRWALEAGFGVEQFLVCGSVSWLLFLGPIGWLEVFYLKLLSVVGRGGLESDLIGVLRCT